MYFRNWEIKCMGNGKGTEFNQPENQTFQIYNNFQIYKMSKHRNIQQLYPSLPKDKTK